MDATQILVSGGWTLFFAAVALSVGKLWVTIRIKEDVKATYAKEIEVHRAQLRAEHDLYMARLQAGTDAAAAAHGAAAERRLEAVAAIWNATSRIGELVTPAAVLIDIYTREELARGAPLERREHAAILEGVGMQLMEVTEHGEVERVRPFVEEPLWSLFFGYRAFAGRVLNQIREGVKRREFHRWLDDEYTAKLVASLMSHDELAASVKRGGILEVFSAVEAKIVQEARRTISGNVAGEAAVARAEAILKAARDARRAAA